MLCLTACLLLSVVQAQVPIIRTTEGQVIGVKAHDGDYFSYYGIHYAGAPTRAYRFKAPTPPRRHADIFEADDNETSCAHWVEGYGISGKEDCLVLNVHTKNTGTRSPVMVILLGDGYYQAPDPNKYSMKQLVYRDIVVVTVNYRLSIFGFLCLGIPEAPGNVGLKDVLQSLRWIHYNIDGFGGDRGNVMLFGHGSGAAMVDLITLSPSSESFVHKAATQSGSALAPWAISYTPVRNARNFAQRLNPGDLTISEMDQQELAKYLLKCDLKTLSVAFGGSALQDCSMMFAPCIENNKLNGSLITKAPLQILRSGDYNHIPYISGFTDKEGTYRIPEAVNEGWLNQMQSNFSNFIPVDLAFASPDVKNNQANIMRATFFGQRPINTDAIRQYIHYFGDAMFIIPVIRGATERALTSRYPVRVYEFAYTGKRGFFYGIHIPQDGAEHGAVLDYLFDHNLNPEATVARDTLLKRYALFAHTGTPSSSSMAYWESISKDRVHMDEDIPCLTLTGGYNSSGFQNFDERTILDPHGKETTFWEELHKKYYVLPTPVSTSNRFSISIVTLLTRLITWLL